MASAKILTIVVLARHTLALIYSNTSCSSTSYSVSSTSSDTSCTTSTSPPSPSLTEYKTNCTIASFTEITSYPNTTTTVSSTITVSPPYGLNRTTSSNYSATTVPPSICTPSPTGLSNSLNLEVCNPCSVTIQYARSLAPPEICYAEYIQTVEVLMQGTSTTLHTILPTLEAHPGTQTVFLTNVDRPKTPAIALALTAVRDATPCFIATTTLTAELPIANDR